MQPQGLSRSGSAVARTRAQSPRPPARGGSAGGRAGGSDLLSPPPQRPVREIRPLIRAPPDPKPDSGGWTPGTWQGSWGDARGTLRPKGVTERSATTFPAPAPRTPARPGAPHELVRPRVPHELLPLLNHLPAALLLFLDDHLGGKGRAPTLCWGLRRSRGVAR